MKKHWHDASESELLTYFDVNPALGLPDTDALARLKRFGNNVDPVLPSEIAKCMQVTVQRNGKKHRITSTHVVPGDIVFLSVGDRLPADVRLLHVERLTCDQSAISGESSAIKNVFVSSSDEDSVHKNIAYCGSFVVSGSAKGIVIACSSETYIAQQRKIKTRKTLANTVLARRLQRQGIIIHNKAALKNYKDISLVFIEVNCSDTEIIDIIRKVQLTQRIPCKFIVSAHQAKRLAKDLNADVWNIDQETNTTTTHIMTRLDIAQFIVGSNHAAFVRIASIVRKKNTIFLWITDGVMAHPAIKIADVSLVLGDKSRGDVMAHSDMIASRAGVGLVTRILYNNK